MKRTVKQIAGPIDGRLYALADDGTVWMLGADIGEWWRVPELPESPSLDVQVVDPLVTKPPPEPRRRG